MRRRASGLPAGKTFDAWEQTASVIPKPTQQALRTLEITDDQDSYRLAQATAGKGVKPLT